MGGRKPRPHERVSIIKQALQSKAKTIDPESDDCLLVSLKHLDRKQGATLDEWDTESILSRAIEVFCGYCHSSLRSQVDGKKFTIYGKFPPSEKTEFTHPPHVPEDAEWARIHVTGTQCLIGHVVKNVFYLVFLDTHHRFWKSELKNT